MNPSYPLERTLFFVLAAVSAGIWAAIVYATRGMALPVLAVAAVLLVFLRSRHAAEIRGAGIRLSENQSPELAARLQRCARRLGIDAPPAGYIVRTGPLAALAGRWLAPRGAVVLDARVVGALASRPGALDFVLGRELGRIRGRHALWDAFAAPGSVLPLLGTAYRRAAEYRLDRYGAACCESDDDVAAGLAALTAGAESADGLDRAAWLEQANEARGLAMSFHELTSDTPWPAKRLAAALAFRSGHAGRPVRRHALAWVLALLVPRLGPTRTGPIGTLVKLGLVAAIGVVGFGEYRDYRIRDRIAAAFEAAQPVLDDVEAYALENEVWPEQLSELGYAADEIVDDVGGYTIAMHAGGIVGIDTGLEQQGWTSYVVLEPVYEDDTFEWLCYGQDLAPEYLPGACR